MDRCYATILRSGRARDARRSDIEAAGTALACAQPVAGTCTYPTTRRPCVADTRHSCVFTDNEMLWQTSRFAKTRLRPDPVRKPQQHSDRMINIILSDHDRSDLVRSCSPQRSCLGFPREDSSYWTTVSHTPTQRNPAQRKLSQATSNLRLPKLSQAIDLRSDSSTYSSDARCMLLTGLVCTYTRSYPYCTIRSCTTGDDRGGRPSLS